MLLVTHLDIVVVVILVWGDTLQKSLRLWHLELDREFNLPGSFLN